MAQIRSGTCTVTNGSATVTFAGVTLVGAARMGHAFNMRGEDAVYSLAADAAEVDGVQTIQLTAPYAGPTRTAKFQITTGFSPVSGLYEPDVNDVDIVFLLKHLLIRKIDGGLGAGLLTEPETGIKYRLIVRYDPDTEGPVLALEEQG